MVRYDNAGDLGQLAVQAGQGEDFWRRFSAEQQMIQGTRQNQLAQDQTKLEAMKLQEAAAMRRLNASRSVMPSRTAEPMVSPFTASKQAYLKSLSLDAETESQLGVLALDPNTDLRDFAVQVSEAVKNRPKKGAFTPLQQANLRKTVLLDEVKQLDRAINVARRELGDMGVNPDNITPLDFLPQTRQTGGTISEGLRNLGDMFVVGQRLSRTGTESSVAPARDAYLQLQRLIAKRHQVMKEIGGLMETDPTAGPGGVQQPTLPDPVMSHPDPLGILR